MGSTMPAASTERPRVIPENARKPLKADLRKPEKDTFWAVIGAAMRLAMEAVGWDLEQLSAALQRDPRQVGRWLKGEERPQVDTFWSVPELRTPFVIALARMTEGIEVTTQITIRRVA